MPTTGGCTASECDGLTCGTAVSTNVQHHSVDDHYIVEKAPQHPVDVTSQGETKTLNVLVNGGSSVGAYTIDLVAPPKLTSEITQFSTLETKRFLRDLRSGKVKQICVLVSEDE